MAPFAFPPTATASSLATLPHRILVTALAASTSRCCFRSAAANAAASFAVAYALCFSFAAAAATAAAAAAAAATATTATVAVTLCRIEN